MKFLKIASVNFVGAELFESQFESCRPCMESQSETSQIDMKALAFTGFGAKHQHSGQWNQFAKQNWWTATVHACVTRASRIWGQTKQNFHTAKLAPKWLDQVKVVQTNKNHTSSKKTELTIFEEKTSFEKASQNQKSKSGESHL